MTLTDIIIAAIIITLFFSGFAQVFLPLTNRWSRVIKEYQSARSIYFVAESFKNECRNNNRNIERWKENVKIVKGLTIKEIKELKSQGRLQAMKLSFNVFEENIEVIGLCIP